MVAKWTKSKEKSRVLAVGAHPDDIEVGCVGTLLKHKSRGDELVVAITTQGGYGDRSWNQIKSEARNASSILGSEYIILDNKIGHYEMTWKTVTELDKIISDFKIDTVYSVWHGDSHQDHRLTFQNVLAACRKKSIRNLYCYELSDYSYRSQNTFNARFFVDISDCMEKKIKSIKCYKSYITQQQIEAVVGLAKHRGLACGSEYAEAFEPVFNIWK